MFYPINTDTPLPRHINNVPKSWIRYINNTYKLSFMYPPQWARIDSLHYAGIDGFFRISLIKADETLEEICNLEAYHKLEPYGSNPDIVSNTSAGLDFCIVVPSADQPSDMKKQAALIIKYPKGIEISNQVYNHIILYTDIEHLYDIANSLIVEK